jgi:CRISPR type III-B/RAMP module RAMP protein Cmr1
MRRTDAAPPPVPERSDAVWRWSADVRSITPIVNGGSESKRIDEGRPIRVPSVRGGLRSWWRATQDTTDLQALRTQESALFGAVHGEKTLASAVRVAVRQATSTPRPGPEQDYALWTLRGAVGPQLHADVRARLDVEAPSEHGAALQRAVDAWLLCGGLGSRTTRGYGILTARAPFGTIEAWASEITRLAPSAGARPWPSLAGATLLTWAAQGSERKALELALQRFREARGMKALSRDEYDGSLRMPAIQQNDWGTIREGRGQLDVWPSLGLPIQVRSSHGHFKGTREIKPAQSLRLPSPILIRVVPVGSQFVPALIVLRLWATPKVVVKGAPGVTGQVRQDGLDAFVAFLQSKGARRVGGVQ